MDSQPPLYNLSLIPIGIVHSTRKNRTDDHWNLEISSITLDRQQFTEEALLGLCEFSHIEVIYSMHQLSASAIVKDSRHPREQKDWPKVGIFAQRGGIRPNRLGLCCCRVQLIEGLTLHVEGLDAIDGTPVIDIKPYFQEFGPKGIVTQPYWASELMKSYWK